MHRLGIASTATRKLRAPVIQFFANDCTIFGHLTGANTPEWKTRTAGFL